MTYRYRAVLWCDILFVPAGQAAKFYPRIFRDDSSGKATKVWEGTPTVDRRNAISELRAAAKRHNITSLPVSTSA